MRPGQRPIRHYRPGAALADGRDGIVYSSSGEWGFYDRGQKVRVVLNGDPFTGRVGTVQRNLLEVTRDTERHQSDDCHGDERSQAFHQKPAGESNDGDDGERDHVGMCDDRLNGRPKALHEIHRDPRRAYLCSMNPRLRVSAAY